MGKVLGTGEMQLINRNDLEDLGKVDTGQGIYNPLSSFKKQGGALGEAGGYKSPHNRSRNFFLKSYGL